MNEERMALVEQLNDVRSRLNDTFIGHCYQSAEGTKLLRKAYSFASNIGKMMSQDTGPEDFLKDYREECADIDAGNYKKGKYWTEDSDE